MNSTEEQIHHSGRRSVWRYDADGGGCFEKLHDGRWVQSRNTGTPLEYVETDRTEDHVELFDPARRLWVRLYDDRWTQRQEGGEWIDGAAGHWE